MVVDELIALALQDPDAASVVARARLADPGVTATGRSIAHQALGLAHRDRWDFRAALRELRLAVRWARDGHDDARTCDARATLGATLSLAGRHREGLAELDAAVAGLPQDPLVRVRRGLGLYFVGRHEAAIADLAVAVDGFRVAGDPVWVAHTLHNLGLVELRSGRLDDAERHTAEARDLLTVHDLPVEALWAEQNLGEIALDRGDLPGALRTFDRVAAGYADLGHQRPSIHGVHARAYLTAGLAPEAAELATRALSGPAAGPMGPLDRGHLMLLAATAQLDAGRPEDAIVTASAARDLLRRSGGEWFELRARLVLVRARRRLGRGRRGAGEARSVATSLHEQRADEAPLAAVLAAELYAGPHRAELLAVASGYRSRGTALTRTAGWWATAVERDDRSDRAGVLRACGRGLDALEEHRVTLGSTELRALATGHGRELAGLALRHAVDDPRALLGWAERLRGSTLAQPSVTDTAGTGSGALAALREAGRRMSEARTEGEAVEQLQREVARLERAVRADHRRRSGTAGAGARSARFDVRRLVDEVGSGCLVELVDVDGVLHVLVVHDGRVRRRVAGTTEAALALTQSAAFVLRRAARGRPYHPGDLGQRLQDELLGDAAGLLPDGPVTVVPTGRLHGVPWALLPALERRACGIVPSAAQWQRARAVPAPAGEAAGGTVLVAGPGLGTGGAEVPVLAQRRPDALLLTGKDATVEAAMSALDGAHLAHVAAHGRFRADSPLFSSLEMADGPLTVYDLERLARAPYRMVLSACESGVLAPVGADELLGLASALFALGTAGLVCSVAEVNDEATAELMVDLHTHLDAGADPAGALLAVREARPADPTSASFVALGV